MKTRHKPTLIEKPARGRTLTGGAHLPDEKFIEKEFPEAVMPTCPIRRVLTGQKAIVTA